MNHEQLVTGESALSMSGANMGFILRLVRDLLTAVASRSSVSPRPVYAVLSRPLHSLLDPAQHGGLTMGSATRNDGPNGPERSILAAR